MFTQFWMELGGSDECQLKAAHVLVILVLTSFPTMGRESVYVFNG